MTTTYKSTFYSPARVARRLVRASQSGETFFWCEVAQFGHENYDIRQGWCEASEVPADVRAKALRFASLAFGSVDWPIERGAAS